MKFFRSPLRAGSKTGYMGWVVEAPGIAPGTALLRKGVAVADFRRPLTVLLHSHYAASGGNGRINDRA